MVNKPNFEENLLNFIKTAHRYSQYMSQKENTFPIALWLFLNEYCNYDEYKRVHVPERASILTRFLNLNDGNGSSDYSILGLINAIAARQYEGIRHFIEYMPGIVFEPNNPNSRVIPYSEHYEKFKDGNLPWPATAGYPSPATPQKINFLH